MYTQILQLKIIHSIIMTQIQHLHTQTFKKLFIILGAFALCGGTLYSAQAVEFGSVQYGKNYIDYSGFDITYKFHFGCKDIKNHMNTVLYRLPFWEILFLKQ